MNRTRFVAVLALWLRAPNAAAAEPPPLAVIVHPQRRPELSVDDLAQLYLRRNRFWNDGDPIRPLNLPGGTPLRAAFSRSVLGERERQIAEYWNRRYFFGILPPPTLGSTEAVRRYVASDPNAIGHVPLSEVDDSVRVLLEID